MSKSKKGGGGASLGRQLLKSGGNKHHGKRTTHEGYLHTAELQDGYDWGRMNLNSVTEDASYVDFLNTAEAARKEFDAEKWNVKLMDNKTRQVYIDTDKDKSADVPLTEEEKILPIPRRPEWTGLTPEELNMKENDTLLEWRRYLAMLQEERGAMITPYEKNLEFWRQLWRVIERSDVVVQILDSRNPGLFRSLDLERYVKEVSPLKRNLLLLNKADYLRPDQRQLWANYLLEKEVEKEEEARTKFAFFSALQEDTTEEEEEANGNNESEAEETATTAQICSSEIFTDDGLLELFRSFKRHSVEQLTVGFIGYPNVGKSSTINKLLNSKKVRVAETPGKTKHFQTLVLTDDVTLCDCPGLVMPSLVVSKADMVLNGILPVDQLRDHVPAIDLLLQHIPTHTLEAKYGLVLPQSPKILNAEQVLTAYATLRGFMATGGRPDQSRAARVLLKDFTCGKLLHCCAPPTIDQDEFHSHDEEVPTRQWSSVQVKELEARRLQQDRKKLSGTEELDQRFFASASLGAHVAGRRGPPTGRLSDKKKKKEKIKRQFPELDAKHA